MYKKKQPPLLEVGFVQSRVNHSPLLQAAIAIGAAIIVVNIGI